jgi:hypothetical protein
MQQFSMEDFFYLNYHIVYSFEMYSDEILGTVFLRRIDLFEVFGK